jgi:hypothetical protein
MVRRKKFLPLLGRSPDSSVSIADKAIGWTTRIKFPVRAKMGFPLRHRIQTGSGALPASYPMRTGGSFTGLKVAGMLI